MSRRRSPGPDPGGPADAARLDLRLLVPALGAWAVLASAVAWPVRPLAWALALVTTATLLAAVGARSAPRLSRPSGRPRGRREHGADPDCGPVQQVLRGVVLAGLLTALLLGAACAEAFQRTRGALPALVSEHATVSLLGTAISDPVRFASHGSDRWVITVAARSVTGRGRSGAAYGPVLVAGHDAVSRLRWRCEVVVTGRLAPADPTEGKVAVLTLQDDPVQSAPPSMLLQGVEGLRDSLRTAVAGLPPDARGLLPGLVIGDTSGVPPDLTEAMRATGLTHLTAVSGSNVSVVLALVLGLCGLVGVPRRLRTGLALAALCGFVLLARPDPSVLRAATMGAIGLIGLSRHGRATGPPVLGAAIIVLLVVDPWLARSFGFALSTLATVGLLVFVRPWGSAIGRRLPGRLCGFGPALAIPLAAQLMCAPVIVLLQESVSTVGILANLIAAPFVAPATIAGVGVALVAPIHAGAGAALAWVAALPTLAISMVARRLETVPGGAIPWPGDGRGALALAALSVVAVLVAPRLRHEAWRRPLAACTVVGLVGALLVPARVVSWPPDTWSVVFCDVGQGDAAVLRVAPGVAVVVDAGPEPALVRGCLRDLGVREVPVVVLTHFHTDHVAGLPGILDQAHVGAVLVTSVDAPADQARQVAQWTAGRHVPMTRIGAGDDVVVGPVHAQVWSPAEPIQAGSVPNNASVVLAVTVGGRRVLMLGDIEREAAHDLLLRLRRDPTMAEFAAHLDVVKTPHHGSANLDPDLIERLHGSWAVISVGVDNDYGHPTAAHIAAFRSQGFAVLRTDESGDVALVDDAEGAAVVTQR